MASSAVNWSYSKITICTGLPRGLLPGLPGGGLESLPVSGRGDAQGADERAPHGLGCPVAAVPGDLLDPVAAVLEPAPGGVQADPVDVTARGHAGLGGEAAGELAGGDAGPGGAGVPRQGRGGGLRESPPAPP